MRTILFTALLAIATTMSAQPTVMKLWPDGAPNSNGLTGIEEDLENGRVANIVDPTITVYHAQSSDTESPAVIICPGGGYARLAMNHEGHDMADWFTKDMNITYIVLKYRMPNENYEVPLSDAEQAIRLVRLHAKEWHINPNKIGIMGASAGGHLASTLATHYSSAETRPDFQILLYPVITMNPEFTHGGSRANLIGSTPTKELEEKFSNELQVTSETPKAFLALSSDDGAVPPQNSISYYTALINHNVSASMHIYPIGGHGWGYRDNFSYKSMWTNELQNWLKQEILND